MAAEVAMMPVNGNYAPHQGYGALEQTSQAYNSIQSSSSQAPSSYGQAPATSSTPTTSNSTTAEIPKDEVGWYFVEQYYTTLSRSPEKLYLFYQKRSQFVSGLETEKVPVCVGQRAINDRIKALDFQDCKVRVTNVDSQASDTNIVIQVIGEISNKSQPHRKFTQTFVLATQTNGYFVLNDIFRYIIEEEDEPETEVEPEALREVPQISQVPESEFQEPALSMSDDPEPEPEPKMLTSSTNPIAIEKDASKVDKEVEEKMGEDPPAVAAPAAVNGTSAKEEAELAHVEDASQSAVAVPAVATATAMDEVSAADAAPEPEKPKTPEQTPAVSPPKQAQSQPAAPPKPAVPKTWATLAAAANRTAPPPATPAAPSAPSSQASQARPAPQTQPVTPAATSTLSATPAPATVAPPSRDDSPANGLQDEWTSVGGDHKRQQSRQTNVSMSQQREGPQTRGYIKNVHPGVDADELKTKMTGYGELLYFDISAQKNCAFVDWKTPEAYQAAVNANPHTVGGERIWVEERRLKPGAYPYVPRGGMRGGRGGSQGQGPPRGNFQGGRGGGYPPRGRGSLMGAAAPRGRGAPPPS